ncbi:MAG: diaminopimelate epimerase [Lentisphaeria bacterium]|nr:diaminopimelate epimerase [Lentisphaeria bacterium]
MKFTKMHGCGNDFVVLDAVNDTLPADLPGLSRRLADRHFGVGCDQVLVVAPSDIADVRMLIFNNDGSEVEMCGNGIRCLAKYVWDTGLSRKPALTVETLAGIIKPCRDGEQVRVDMGVPRFDTADWDMGSAPVIARELAVGDTALPVTLVSMGNPHCVSFHDALTDDLVLGLGPQLESHPVFPNRINVEFIQVVNRSELIMRVWERGSGETLACGTGASASCVAAVLNDLTERNVLIRLKGGNLHLEWGSDNHVHMTGPAVTVFRGEWRD